MSPPDNRYGSTHRPSWCEKYGQRHRPIRIKEFPEGIIGPKRVRIYRRNGRYLLQWWDSIQKKTQSDRVDGDLLSALLRAREIEERLEHFRSAGQVVCKIDHEALVERYLEDLERRANGGEVDYRTFTRYSSALRRHYLAFATRPDIERRFRHAASVNREFRLELAAYLSTVQIHPNGHLNSRPRPLKGQEFVIDIVRAVFEWAADPDRGNLMPAGFRNPFARRGPGARPARRDQYGEPDITVPMTVDFLGACDAYQLQLFVPIVCFGLRAAEPCFIFREDVKQGWLTVTCRPELVYKTKGRREKRLPVIPCIEQALGSMLTDHSGGPLYCRRAVRSGKSKPRLLGKPLDKLVEEFQRRSLAAKVRTAEQRRRLRDHILREAGGITYDHVADEFRRLARQLDWPSAATSKDFRHLFATLMENAGMPENYRRYLLGHSPGRAPIVAYTHLNEVRQRYQEAVEAQLQPIVRAVVTRCQELDLTACPSDV